jgi:hypothetical protein
MPEVDFAMFCEEAYVSDGFLYAKGAAWDTLVVEKVPAAHQTALALRLLFEPSDCGRTHEVEVFIQDIDGKRIAFGLARPHPELDPTAPAHWLISSIVTISFLLPLPVYGEYSLEVVIDGESSKSAQLRAVPGPVGAPQGPDPNYVI